ncbi:MAG: hypothetical protein A3F67_05905 [Verrucomicrobia bacterium RIFCSPHIGHO2_12_FULL_41_10]|nr:MAG: hypothetical protein A3F67_05905 [Verrucomicrobia bacterium RIFCSPHIGHO2_12_FULL_41_10]
MIDAVNYKEVENKINKFPHEYIMELDKEEWASTVKSKISTSPLGGGKVKTPKAFTEKGLYMLATILKSSQATKTTLAIIDTFSKVREIGQIVSELPTVKENSQKHGELLHRASDIISELVVIPGKTESEACVELNFAVVKFKYSLKKKV